jgi:hypothetical protein
MCDKLKETDEKYTIAKQIIAKDGCVEANLQLTQCLKSFSNDWRMCHNQTTTLKNCLDRTKKDNPNKEST